MALIGLPHRGEQRRRPADVDVEDVARVGVRVRDRDERGVVLSTRLLALATSGELGELREVEIHMVMPPPDDGDPRWRLDLAGALVVLQPMGAPGMGVGAALTQNPVVRKLSFTGSTRVGAAGRLACATACDQRAMRSAAARAVSSAVRVSSWRSPWVRTMTSTVGAATSGSPMPHLFLRRPPAGRLPSTSDSRVDVR